MHEGQDSVDRTLAAAEPLVKSMGEKVAEFNSLIVGFPVPDEPQLLPEDRQAFRQGFQREELAEIDAAYAAGNLAEVVDGHVDAIYVHLGSLYEMGVTPGPAFDLVHDANMQKQRGTKSTRPGSKGFDTVKPPGWKAPDHTRLLSITREEIETIYHIRSGLLQVGKGPADFNALMADAQARKKGENIDGSPRRETVIEHTRVVQKNDDFEFVGSPVDSTHESLLIGADGFVLSVDRIRQQADVRFYKRELPQLMTVSLREIKYKPKRKVPLLLASDDVRPAVPEQLILGLDYSSVEDRVAAWMRSGIDGGVLMAAPHVQIVEPRKPRVMVLGYARHGKDTVADLLQTKYGLRFTSSSAFCAERVVLPAVKALWEEWRGGSPVPKPTIPDYETVQECFEDRHNHRAFWFEKITAFNTPDLTSLGRAIFEQYDLYCGIRNAREYHALANANAFDVAIWVDAFERIGSKEDPSSCTVEPWMADFVLDNNGSLSDLERGLDSLVSTLKSCGVLP